MVADFIHHRPISHQIEARAESRSANTTVTSMNKTRIKEEPIQQTLNYILRRMDLRDKYALAIEAAALHTTTSSLASIKFVEEPGEELASARKLLEILSDKEKILLAIELLSSDLDDDEDDDDEDDEDEDDED